MEVIEQDSQLVQRIVNVLNAGHLQGIAQQLDHPATPSVIKQLEDLE